MRAAQRATRRQVPSARRLAAQRMVDAGLCSRGHIIAGIYALSFGAPGGRAGHDGLPRCAACVDEAAAELAALEAAR